MAPPIAKRISTIPHHGNGSSSLVSLAVVAVGTTAIAPTVLDWVVVSVWVTVRPGWVTVRAGSVTVSVSVTVRSGPVTVGVSSVVVRSRSGAVAVAVAVGTRAVVPDPPE